jgi:uncharacterized membrane protein SirB2
MVSRIERWAPIAGIVFVVLMITGKILVSDVPSPNAPQREIVGYLTDGARQTHNLIGAYLWTLGALAFLVFLIRLRNDLRRAEGGTGFFSNLAFGAGAAFAAVWLVAASISASVAYAIRWRGAPVSDADLVRVLPPLGRLLLLLGGGFAGVILLLAASVVILRTGVFGRWLGWLGIAAAIVLLFDVVYLDISPFWVWVGIASIVMLARRGETASTPFSARREKAATASA